MISIKNRYKLSCSKSIVPVDKLIKQPTNQATGLQYLSMHVLYLCEARERERESETFKSNANEKSQST